MSFAEVLETDGGGVTHPTHVSSATERYVVEWLKTKCFTMYIFKFKRLVNSITVWQKKEKIRQREIATLSESRGESWFSTPPQKNG